VFDRVAGKKGDNFCDVLVLPHDRAEFFALTRGVAIRPGATPLRVIAHFYYP